MSKTMLSWPVAYRAGAKGDLYYFILTVAVPSSLSYTKGEKPTAAYRGTGLCHIMSLSAFS